MKIEEQLLTHRTIFLNLSLKERAMGLDRIVKDLSSFYSLPVYFWNLSKEVATKVELKEDKRTPRSSLLGKQNFNWNTLIISHVENSVEQKSLTSILTKRLQDLPQTSIPNKTVYQVQSFESIITALIRVYESSLDGIFIIENINQLISSHTLDVFQFEQLKNWILKLTQKSRQHANFYLIILGNSEKEWEFGDIAPEVKLPYLNSQEVIKILKEKFAKLKLNDSDKNELLQKAGHTLSGLSQPELLWGVDSITNSLDEDLNTQTYIERLLEYKQNKLKQLGLSFLPPPEIGEIGGMDLLKENIKKLEIEFAVDRSKYNIPETDGWILVGIPGVGKSLSAKVIQIKLSLPMIHIPAEKVKENGPAYLARILKLCEANAPNIIYFDELEKIFPEGNLQSDGTSTLGVFLTWLQEKTAPCFVLATLNRLDNLPPELIRAGRFSEIWYVGFPQPNERREIFNLYLRKYDHRYREDILDLSQWRELIDESIRFTGAEIAQVVEKSYTQKYYEHAQTLNKLKEETYHKSERLIELIKKGYYQKLTTARTNAVNFDHLDHTISKVLGELADFPQLTEAINSLYCQFSTANNQATNFSDLQKNLKETIYAGYTTMIEHYEQKIINIDNLDEQISQALVDLAEQPQQVEQIEQLDHYLTETQEKITQLDSQPLEIDYNTLLRFTLEEVPLFERAVEKVMAIENRARKICRPVASKDESDLIDREPTFWPEMRESEALEIIQNIRGAEAEQEGIEYTAPKSIDEAVELKPGLAEYNAAYWAF